MQNVLRVEARNGGKVVKPNQAADWLRNDQKMLNNVQKITTRVSKNTTTEIVVKCEIAPRRFGGRSRYAVVWSQKSVQ